jgi:pimeloyl-ACP methyl ester carboxylesterase
MAALQPSTGEQERLALPEPGRNNFWYRYADLPASLIFVHGVLSDSRSCWLRAPVSLVGHYSYWPHIVASDPRFERFSIYLGGYYTAIDSGAYEVRNCAHELFAALQRPGLGGERAALENDEVIFVCHSTGGIVVRYLVEKYWTELTSKRLGLVLIASPSYGSQFADRLALIAQFYNHHLGAQLRWGSWSLRELDTSFKELIHQKRLPGLCGVEACENHFIIRRRFLPSRRLVVTEESAGRYFGAPVMLRDTDHFNSAKPDDIEHPSHELLVDFALKYFPGALATTDQPAARTSYFCYISHDKVDQLLESVEAAFGGRAVRGVRPAEMSNDLELIAQRRLAYGHPDMLLRNATLRQAYVYKLGLLVRTITPMVRAFDSLTKSDFQPPALLWYRGEFQVSSIDDSAQIATLTTESPLGTLVLDCSLRYFANSVDSGGKLHLHSTNYAFFKGNLPLSFRTIVLALGWTDAGLRGTPLYLELTAAAKDDAP